MVSILCRQISRKYNIYEVRLTSCARGSKQGQSKNEFLDLASVSTINTHRNLGQILSVSSPELYNKWYQCNLAFFIVLYLPIYIYSDYLLNNSITIINIHIYRDIIRIIKASVRAAGQCAKAQAKYGQDRYNIKKKRKRRAAVFRHKRPNTPCYYLESSLLFFYQLLV